MSPLLPRLSPARLSPSRVVVGLAVALLPACSDGCNRPKVDDTGDSGETADSGETGDTGNTDTVETGDTDTGETAHTGDTETGDTTVDSVDSGHTGDTHTGDSGPDPIDTSIYSDTGGPGSDPDPDEPVAEPKWHRMWFGDDLGGWMDGRASYDPAGRTLSYAWYATEGEFDDPTSATPFYTGADGIVTLVVSTSTRSSDPVSIYVASNTPGARIPEDYATVDDALLAGESILYLAPGTYGPISGASAIIGDPNGGVIIDAGGADVAVLDPSYLRHLTITGAAVHGVEANGDVRMHDVVVEANGTTDNDGGGIWSDATVILQDVVVQDNAGNLGGGIYLERSASMYAQQCVIADNTALYGGGIYTNTTAGNVTLWNSLLVGNDASVNGGGGIFLDSRAFIERTTVADNGNGGIRLRFGYFEVQDSLFAGNNDYAVQEADSPTVHLYDSAFDSADIIDGGAAPDGAGGNVVGTVVFTDVSAGRAWTSQDFTLTSTSTGFDMLAGQDRDASPQDAGAYGGFLGRLPSGLQGIW